MSTCPRCESTNCISYEAAWTQGTSTVEAGANTTGVAIGGGSAFGAVTTISGIQTTRLADACQPPRKRKGLGCLTTLSLAGGMIGLTIAGIAFFMTYDQYKLYRRATDLEGLWVGVGALAVGVPLTWIALRSWVRIDKWNKQHPQRLAEWRRSWVCLKCNNHFVRGS